MSRYARIIFEDGRLDMLGHYGTVAFNRTDKHFYKIVARNEDGTAWAKRHGRLVVLKRDREGTYMGLERTVRYWWSELASVPA